MIEILIVLAILAILMILFLLVFRTQLARGRDARRKSDLEKIKIAFEEYFNDNGCYPPADILNNCGGDELRPYLDRIPCDPFTRQSYIYIPEPGATCSGYRLFTSLEDGNDPAIGRIGCDSQVGCGFGADWNYGVSAGVPLVGSPGLDDNTYACAPGGICNIYASPGLAGCPVSWQQSDCYGQCGNPNNWCVQ